jgi:hypothetical protein
MGARSGAVLDRTPRVKCLRIREDFDDSVCLRPAQHFAGRHDSWSYVDRSGLCSITAGCCPTRCDSYGATGCDPHGRTCRTRSGA